MHMYFWWGIVVDNFLFPGYNIKTVGGFVTTCVALLILAIFLEWLKLIQARLRQQELLLRAKQLRTICPPSESSTLLFNTRRLIIRSGNVSICDRALLIIWDALAWLNLHILGYLLMLTAMIYNGWMLIALVIGSSIGYFLFGPSFIKLNLQNCQIIQDTFCSLNCSEPEEDGETTPTLGASTSVVCFEESPHQVSVCVHAEGSGADMI